MNNKILIADDDRIVVKLIETYLQPAGYETISAEDGLDALMKIKNEHPDLVILDVVMPEINGYDICYQLRFSGKFDQIPILLVTERENEIGEIIGKRVNLDHVQKPIQKEQLLEKIDALLQ